MTKKNTKAAAPIFSTVAFFDAGYQAGRNDAHEQVIIAAVAEDKLSEAKDAYIEGYVLGGLAFKAGTEPTKGMRQQVRSIMRGCNPEATPKDGQYKRTKAEHDLFRAGGRRFNRMRAKLGVAPASNIGGHGKNKKDEPAPEAVTVKIGKIENAPEMAQTVHVIKERWAALMKAGEKVNLPSEVSDLSVQITVMLNRFEKALGEIK